MSIQYGSLYVDEQYKATVLPNLFYKTWLVPGVTYQDVMVDGARRLLLAQADLHRSICRHARP